MLLLYVCVYVCKLVVVVVPPFPTNLLSSFSSTLTGAAITSLLQVHDMDFLRINAQPIKQALGTWVTKWMYLYTQHLQEHIASKLQDVALFIKTVNAGLDIKPDNQVRWCSVRGAYCNALIISVRG